MFTFLKGVFYFYRQSSFENEDYTGMFNKREASSDSDKSITAQDGAANVSINSHIAAFWLLHSPTLLVIPQG